MDLDSSLGVLVIVEERRRVNLQVFGGVGLDTDFIGIIDLLGIGCQLVIVVGKCRKEAARLKAPGKSGVQHVRGQIHANPSQYDRTSSRPEMSQNLRHHQGEPQPTR